MADKTAEPIIRAYAASKIDVSDGERAVVAKINTDEVDRYGTVIEPKGIDLNAYRTNPVVLWEHGQDSARGRVPVGRNQWVRYDKGDNSLIAKTIFADDEFSDGLFRLYQNDILRGFSINGLPREYSRPEPEEIRSRPDLAKAHTIYRSTELTEYSAVSVPGNRTALALAVSRGLWLPDSLKRSMDDDDTLTESNNTAIPDEDEADKKRGIVHNTETGKWCVHGPNGEKLGEFDTKDDAEEFAAEEAKERERAAQDEKRNYRLRSLTRMVKKDDDGYCVYSADGKKKLGGPYKTKAEAEKRLREVEHFKEQDATPDGDRTLDLPPLTGRTFSQVLEHTVLGIRAEVASVRAEETARRDLRRGIV